MISRIWHGYTTPENAPIYEDLLLGTVIPAIRAMEISGLKGIHVLKRELEEEFEFITVMWFDSLDSVRSFVKGDYEVAHVPEEARAVLSRFDGRSQHYDVLLEP